MNFKVCYNCQHCVREVDSGERVAQITVLCNLTRKRVLIYVVGENSYISIEDHESSLMMRTCEKWEANSGAQ